MQTSLYHHFTLLDSTNTLAVKMAEQGAEHGTVIHADSQSGGRGRGDREFLSPVGGLYFSLILRPKIELSALPLITLAAGVGLCRGISSAANVHAKIWLKWPNDLYCERKKLAGILAESGPVRRGGEVDFIVVGAGVNVSTKPEQFPSELRDKIIPLAQIVDQELNIADLLSPLTQEVLAAVQRLSGENRADLLAEWRDLDYLLDRSLDYIRQDTTIPATGIGLADDGRYVLVDRCGTEHRVTAGDLNPIRSAF